MMKLVLGILLILSIKSCSKSNNPEDIFTPYRFETLTLSNGLKLNYKIQGNLKGKNMILVHGGGDSQSMYNSWINTLKTDFKIITFDLPGHGLSSPFQNKLDYGAPKFSETLNLVVKALNIDKFILAGHSFGGDAATRFTLENPNKVTGLILIGSGGFLTTEELKARNLIKNLTDEQAIETIFGPQYPNAIITRDQIRQSLKGFTYNPNNISNDAIERFYTMAQYKPNKDTYNQMQINYLRNHQDLENLETLQVPTLLLWGAKDPLVPVKIAIEKFDSKLPNSELVILNNIGHLPLDEAPQESIESLVKFLKKNNLN
ncbi:alpha/beta fold hydrolase [Tenacibaculum aiptasiae]|uniref:alpha/beta fold hydrolase n=1 Tax=Tenacibaculum aiptasiae TaxID=426481 RepID=UPI00232FD757|nr:alpha/beta hydrolase [Tenacibaculum aiptasiae]